MTIRTEDITDEEVEAATFADRDKLLVYVDVAEALCRINLGIPEAERDDPASKQAVRDVLSGLVVVGKKRLLARRKEATRRPARDA